MALCDPACQKIIINSGLVAAAAELLASITSGELSHTAKSLAAAARAVRETYDGLEADGLIAPSDKFKWDGCDEASTLWTWISEAENDVNSMTAAKGESALTMMRGWRSDLIDLGHAMASGE